MADFVEIKPGTIEGWELGRVAKPPLHDVIRLAHVLGISAGEIEAAVFEDTGVARSFGAPAPEDQSLSAPGSAPRDRAMPLLEAAFKLFGWKNDTEAAEALTTTSEHVRRWRTGADPMTLGDFLALTSMIGIVTAAAMKGQAQARLADIGAAAHALGVRDPFSIARGEPPLS